MQLVSKLYFIIISLHYAIISNTHIFQGDIGTISPDPIAPEKLSVETQVIYSRKRKSYGGKQDKLHLGGFTSMDIAGVSENTWNWMLSSLGIRSLIDLGCGRGISTSYFFKKGVKVLCIEGSHDAIQQSLLPTQMIIQHDFTLGPWWPNTTYDAVWSVEFVEHVGRHYMRNYLPVFRRASLIFLTYGTHGGWHHVEVRDEWWWKARFQAQGFIYSEDLTKAARKYAKFGRKAEFEAQHIIYNMLVFINPAVASLPESDHLMSGHGCMWEKQRGLPCEGHSGGKNSIQYKWWSAVDRVPDRYQPLINCTEDPEKHIWKCD